jgi:hypothetical protein
MERTRKTKHQTAQYIAKLQKLGLEIPPRPFECPSPDMARLVDQSSRIAIGVGGSTSLNARVVQAIRLWRTAHAEIYAKEQGKVLAKGLLILNQSDWAKHAKPLVWAFDQIATDVPSLEDLIRLKSFGRRTRAKRPPSTVADLPINENGIGALRAGKIVESIWCSFSWTNDEVLRALFPGLEGCWQSRTHDFLEMLAVARQRLWGVTKFVLADHEINDRRRPIQFDDVEPDELDLINAEMRDAWRPLGSYDNDSAWCVSELLRLKRPDPESFCKSTTFAQYPRVARWLASLRQ